MDVREPAHHLQLPRYHQRHPSTSGIEIGLDPVFKIPDPDPA